MISTERVSIHKGCNTHFVNLGVMSNFGETNLSHQFCPDSKGASSSNLAAEHTTASHSVSSVRVDPVEKLSGRSCWIIRNLWWAIMRRKKKRSERKRLTDSSPAVDMPIHRPSLVPLVLHLILPFRFVFVIHRHFYHFIHLLASAVASQGLPAVVEWCS